MGRAPRKVLIICVALIAPVLVGGASATTRKAQVTKITVAYANAATNFTALFAAQGEGFFAKNGLEVNSFLATGGRGNSLLQSGSAQFNLDSGQPNLTAIARGSSTVLLGATNNRFGFKLIARKPIAKIADLRGKKLALSSPNAAVGTAGEALLAANGLTTKDVQLVYIASITARLAALDAGTVDAIILSPPVNTLMKTGKFNDIYDLRSLRFVLVGIWGQRDYVAKNPETTRAFLRSMTQAMQFLSKPSNKAKSLTYVAQATGFSDADSIEEGYDYEIPRIQFEPLVDRVAIQNSNKAVAKEIGTSADIDGFLYLSPLEQVLTYSIKGSAGAKASLTASVNPQGVFPFRLRTAGIGKVTAATLHIGRSGSTRATLCRNCKSNQTGSTRAYAALAKAIKSGNGYLRLATKAKPRGAVTIRLNAELGR
jgi:NitT/TauT family transport system substrate-binding protein